MRFHPRRHGAYNFSARAASAFTNTYFKNRKTQEKQKTQHVNQNYTSNDNSGFAIGCLTLLIILGFISFLAKACSS